MAADQTKDEARWKNRYRVRPPRFHGSTIEFGNGQETLRSTCTAAIMGVTDPKIKVDHIEIGNGLNNTYENLTDCNSLLRTSENMQKAIHILRASIKGVSWRKDEQLWVARIQVEGKSVFLHYHQNRRRRRPSLR